MLAHVMTCYVLLGQFLSGHVG